MDQNFSTKEKVAAALLKAGKRTYFFDVYTASNSKKYLKITESRMPREGEAKGQRVSLLLWPEDAENFQVRLTEMLGHLS